MHGIPVQRQPLFFRLPNFHPTMPYALCILGCGTMGISVLSGVLDNLSSPLPASLNLRNDDSTPPTPVGALLLESKIDSVPNR